MTNPFLSVDPKALADAGRTLEDPAKRLRNAVIAFDAAAAEAGPNPWGNDEIGQQFGAAYNREAPKVITAIHDLADSADNINDKVNVMAGNYTDTEDANSN